MRFLDVGEIYGKVLIVIVEGFFVYVKIDIENINYFL